MSKKEEKPKETTSRPPTTEYVIKSDKGGNKEKR
jgi:hypothetical protein